MKKKKVPLIDPSEWNWGEPPPALDIWGIANQNGARTVLEALIEKKPVCYITNDGGVHVLWGPFNLRFPKPVEVDADGEKHTRGTVVFAKASGIELSSVAG